jgi:putative transposase
MDNGPEFISVTLADWADKHAIKLEFIKPGKPTQNSYVERFNRTYRTEVLNMYAFRRLSEVREITDNWIREYNEERPHDSLGDLTPREYLMANSNRENSKSQWT